MMSDDGAGIRVIRELSKIKWSREVAVMEVGTALFSCLDEISQTRCLIAVDAITAGKKPGTIYRVGDRIAYQNKGKKTTLSHNQLGLEDYPGKTSHTFSLLDIISLARGLTGLPERLIIFGVEPEKISPGTNLSRAVSGTIVKIKKQILIEVRGLINELNHN